MISGRASYHEVGETDLGAVGETLLGVTDLEVILILLHPVIRSLV